MPDMAAADLAVVPQTGPSSAVEYIGRSSKKKFVWGNSLLRYATKKMRLRGALFLSARLPEQN